MYKRYLDKFDLKLLTKLPKKGFVPVLGGEINVNHVPIDINLRVTYVYCISSLTPNNKETSEYFNEIDSSAQNFVLNKFYGKYYTYFNIIFIILRFITDKFFQWSPRCVGSHLSQWMRRFILFTDNQQVSWQNTNLGVSRVREESWRQIVRLQYWWQVQIHFKIILIFNFIDNKKNCEVSRTLDSFVLYRSENLTSSLMNK